MSTTLDEVRVARLRVPADVRDLRRHPDPGRRRAGVVQHRRWRRGAAVELVVRLGDGGDVVRGAADGRIVRSTTGWAVSTSSTTGWLVVALRRAGAVGVDVVEHTREVLDGDLATVLHHHERRLVDTTAPACRAGALRAIAARKEAVLKVAGVAIEPCDIDCSRPSFARVGEDTYDTRVRPMPGVLLAIAWPADVDGVAPSLVDWSGTDPVPMEEVDADGASRTSTGRSAESRATSATPIRG